jgi:hypothetical protein
MGINHEETKSAKRNQKNLRALRFFVVDFPQKPRDYKLKTLTAIPDY